MISRTTNQDMHNGLSPPGKPTRSWVVRLSTYLFGQLLALAVFVGFPVLATAIAPVSWIKFERRDDQVSASAKICLLFVVPYKTLTVEPVVGIGDRFVEGSVTRERRPGRDKFTKSEDQSFLVIQGSAQTAEVPVTPVDLESVVDRSAAFLNDPNAKELNLFVVANWKFSVIMGGLLSLLTVLYVATVTFGGVLKVIHMFQWICGVPPERRLMAKVLKDSETAVAKGH